MRPSIADKLRLRSIDRLLNRLVTLVQEVNIEKIRRVIFLMLVHFTLYLCHRRS
jgi:hypothetical protein